MPNSRRRLLTTYEAMPKMPVTASIAPSKPRTPSATVATRAAKRAESISSVQVLTIEGQRRNRGRAGCVSSAAAISCGSRLRPDDQQVLAGRAAG